MALEYRILDSLPIVLTQASYTAETATASSVPGGDIVRDENQHGMNLPPDERRIAIDIAPEAPC